jgi:quinolinate synthase
MACNALRGECHAKHKSILAYASLRVLQARMENAPIMVHYECRHYLRISRDKDRKG